MAGPRRGACSLKLDAGPRCVSAAASGGGRNDSWTLCVELDAEEISTVSCAVVAVASVMVRSVVLYGYSILFSCSRP